MASSKDANYTFVPKGYTVPDDVTISISPQTTQSTEPSFARIQM